MRKGLLVLLLLNIVFFYAHAGLRTAVTGNWTTSGGTNTAWGGVTVTSSADSCVIPNGVTVTVQGAVTCGSFVILQGGTLTFQGSSGRNITVVSGGGHFGIVSIDGTVNMANSNTQYIQWNGASLTIGVNASWTWAGTSSGTNGGIWYNGTGTTTITGNGKIIGSLTASSGTVNISGSINFRGQGTSYGCMVVGATATVNIPSTSTVTLSSNTTASNDFVFTSGGKINIDGVLDNRAGTTNTLVGAGALTVNNGGRYIHNHTSATLQGSVAGTVVWNTGSTCEIGGYTTGQVPGTSFAQTFSNFNWNCTAQSGTINISNMSGAVINGKFTVVSTNSQILRLSNNNTAFTLTTRDFEIQAGTLEFTGASGTTTAKEIFVGGDFTISGGTIAESGTATSRFTFNKSGTQTFVKSGGTISNTIDFLVNSGSTVDFGTNVLDGSSGTFTLSAGAGLITANTAGIASTGATGTIQVTGTRTYSTSANYTFNGTATQNTGSGFTGANNLTINNTAASPSVNLTASATITGNLTLTTGQFRINGGGVTLTYSGSNLTRTTGTLDVNTNVTSFLTFTNASPLSIPANTFLNVRNLTINGTGGVTINSNINISGTGTFTSGTLNVNGFTLGFSTGVTSISRTSGDIDASAANSTVSFSNTSPLTLPANLFTGNITNLNINGAGGVTLGSATTVTSALSLGSNGTLTIGANTFTYAGSNLTRTTGFIDASNASAVMAFTNSSSLTLPASVFTGNITTLTINGAGGVVLGSAITITNTLNLTNGTLNNSTHNVSLSDGATIVRSASAALLSAVPAFGATVNVTYNNSATLITDNELPTVPSSPATTLNNLTINSSGTSVNVTLKASAASIQINGVLALSGSSTGTFGVSSNTITFGPSASITRTGTVSINASNTAAVLDFENSSTITLPASAIQGQIGHLTINGAGGIVLGNAHNILTSLNLTNGNIDLSTFNLTVNSTATLTGGSSSSFIITSNIGKLIRQILSGGDSFTFPLARNSSNYTPLTITNTGSTTSIYTVGVASTTYTPAADGANAQWSIASSASTTSTLAFQWASADAGANLSASAASGKAYQFNGSTWDNRGGSTTGTPNVTTISGITDLSNPIWTVVLPLVVPDIAISANTPSAGNIVTATTNNVLYGVQLVVTSANASLTSVTVNTTGTDTYAASAATDLTNFKLWINTTNSLSGATQLGNTITNAPALGGSLVFNTGSNLPFSVTTATGTYYLFITCDVASGAVPGRIITISSTAFSNINFASANKTGTDPVAAGNTQTIIAVPTVITNAASSIATTSVVLNGAVNANANSTVASFDYGTTISYGTNILADQSPVTGTSSTAISKSISSLLTNTLYNYRAKGVNDAGTTNGTNTTFTTLSNAPTVGVGDNQTGVGFRANWSISNDGSEALTYQVEVTTVSGDYSSPAASQSGISTTNFTFTTLSPSTTYYYRVRAVNAGGNSAWSAESAGVNTTGASTPVVTTGSVTANSIVVDGGEIANNEVVSDGGSALTARGLRYNTTSPAEGAGGTSVAFGTTAVGIWSQSLTSLSANTLYYVKAYAANSNGTSYGTEVSFTTLAVEPTTPSTVTFGARTTNSIVVNFTGGNGGRRFVVARALNNSFSFTPTDRIALSGTINADFTVASNQGGGDKIVYDGTGTSVTVTGLTANTAYYFVVYEYNNNSASSPNYYLTAGNGNTTTYNPVITVTSSITAFGNVAVGSNSSAQSYTVSGTELVSNISITPPVGFQVATQSDFSDAVTNPSTLTLLKNVSDIVPSTTIHVRFAPTTASGTISGNISHAATDAATQNVAVSGNAIAIQPTTEGSISFGTVSATSIEVNLPTIGDGARRIIVVKAGSAVDANPVDATSYTANATFASGAQIGTGNYVVYNGTGSSSNVVTVTGLSAFTIYHFAVFEYNEGTGTSQNYLTPSTVIANQQTANITVATDAFRSFQTGDWNSTSTWESFSNGIWITATLTPDAAASAITVRNTHVITIPTTISISADDIIIDAGGRINIASGATLTVANGAAAPDLTVNGYLQNSGTLTLTGTATVSGSTATYEHNLNNVNPPSFTWANNSTLRLTGTYTGAGTNPTGRLSAGAYQNITYEGTIATATDFVSFGDNAVTIAGKLTVNGNGSGALLTSAGTTTNLTVASYEQTSGIVFINRNGSATRTLTVTGNATISGGTLFVKTVGSAFTGEFLIGGNLLVENSGIRLCLNNQASANGTGLVTVTGNVSINNGATVQINATTGTGTPLGRLQVAGDLSVDATSTLTNAATVGFANLDFIGTGTQQFNMLGTFSSPSFTTTLRLLGAGTVSLNNPISVGSVFLTAGTLTNASNLTVAGGSTVTRTVGSFSGNPNYGTGVNVTFIGTSVSSGSELTPASGTVGTLTINSSTNTYTLSNNISVGAITITAGTLDVSTSNYNINVSGNWANTGVFTARSGTVIFNGTSTISGTNTFNNITVAAASSLNTAAISIRGNLINNNSFTATGAITFNGTANQTISGAGSTTTFTTITINNTGTPFATNGVVEVTCSVFTANAGFLTLTAGVFKLSGSFSFTNTFFATAGYTIPASTGLWLNNTNAVVTGQNGSPTCAGLFRVTNGIYNIGTSNNSMQFSSNASIIIEGGVVNAGARFAVATATNTTSYNQSGGIVYVNTAATTNASGSLFAFDMGTSNSSSFTMSGGTIVVRAASSAAAGDYRGPASGATVSITGGVLQLGTAAVTTPSIAATPASTTFNIQGIMPNLTINSTNNPVARLLANISVYGDVSIVSGTTLNANNFSINILGNNTQFGNWSNAGTFTNTGSTVTFVGTGNRSLTGATTFNNLTLTLSLGDTLSILSPISINGNLISDSPSNLTGIIGPDFGSLNNNNNTVTVMGYINAWQTGAGKILASGSGIFASGKFNFIEFGSGSSYTLGSTFIVDSLMILNANVTANGAITSMQTSPSSLVVANNFQILGNGFIDIYGTFRTTNVNGFSGVNASIPDAVISFGTNATVEYNATVPQTVSARTDYVNVSLTGNSLKTLNGNATIAGQLNLTNSSDVLSIANNTLSLNGTVTGNGFLRGSSTANVSIGGTGALGQLQFDQTTDGTTNVLNSLTYNRPSTFPTYSATIGNKLIVTNVVTPTDGLIHTNNNLHLRSTVANTARVAQGSSAGGYIYGDVTVERNITALTNRAYRLLTPGVTTTTSIKQNWQEGVSNTAQNVNIPSPTAGYGTHITGSSNPSILSAANAIAGGFDVTQNNQYSLYTYNQSTQDWQVVTNTNVNTLDAKKGYLIFVRGNRDNINTINTTTGNSNTTLRARGTLLQGNQVFTGLANSTNLSLVTNPFASPVNWANIYTGSNATNFENFITIWDPNVGTRGGFVTVNNSNDVSPTSNLTTQIQSGQAFFVKTKTGITSPSFTIDEAHKSTTSNLDVFRNNTIAARLRIDLRYTVNNIDRVGDGVLLKIDNTFSNTVDDKDAEQIANWDEDVAIVRDAKTLSIESRSFPVVADTIRLQTLRLRSAQGSYRWVVSPDNFTTTTTEAFLLDNFTGATTALSLTAPTTINFTVTSNAASSATNRFSIVLRANNALPVSITSLRAIKNAGSIAVKWQVVNEQSIMAYEVERSADAIRFTQLGSVQASRLNEYSYDDVSPLPNTSFYRLKIKELNGATSYSNIVKINAAKPETSITVYPNPIIGNTLQLFITHLPKDVYQVKLVNPAGQTVQVYNLRHDGGSSTITVPLNSSISSGTYQLLFSNSTSIIHTQTVIKQ